MTDNSLTAWLDEKNGTAKAILFTDKSTVSALLRSLAIDYLGVVNVGQVRNKEATSVETFGIDKFPTFVLLPGGDAAPVVYDGELKKEPMSEFLAQAGPANPDPAPEKEKKVKKDKPAEKKPTEEAKPAEPAEPPKPKPAPVVPTIDEAGLREKCLSETSKVCALLLLPSGADAQAAAADALESIALVYEKHARRAASFPFFAVDAANPAGAELRKALGLDGDGDALLQVVAVNAKRMWWRRYAGEGFAYDAVEAWVDAIRMNEGKREALPASLVPRAEDKFEDDVKERDEL